MNTPYGSTPRKFYVGDNWGNLPRHAVPPCFVLADDRWDDYGYKTTYGLAYWPTHDRSQCIEIGAVKIASTEMRDDENGGGPSASSRRSTDLPGVFESLVGRQDENGGEYFSLGQEPSYYEVLLQLPDALGASALKALRDIALDVALYEQVRDLEVTSTSLLRSLSDLTVTEQFRRILTGGPTLKAFQLTYGEDAAQPAQPLLELGVDPESSPPTNIHAVIGRNGAGKSHLLRAILAEAEGALAVPESIPTAERDRKSNIAGIVYVSFSAFDQPIAHGASVRAKRVHIVGLHDADSAAAGGSADPMGLHPRSVGDLTSEFRSSLSAVQASVDGRRRWLEVFRGLGRDGSLAAVDFEPWLDSLDDGAPSQRIHLEPTSSLFEGMSSGHKIVLLTMTKLVELVAEKTLVLIDEPETHLHPPLLASFIRSLSKLMEERNGVAVLATHSPVVLQEVPRSCVTILERRGAGATSRRPEIETYGENVGILTTSAFGLDVDLTGFHATLSKLAEESPDFDSAVARLNGRLGFEGRLVLRALLNRTQGDDR